MLPWVFELKPIKLSIHTLLNKSTICHIEILKYLNDTYIENDDDDELKNTVDTDEELEDKIVTDLIFKTRTLCYMTPSAS